MIVAVLAFLGGGRTILSPCILPVLPFVLARTEQPFARSTLPLLIGMAATFAALSTLAAVGGSWAVHLKRLRPRAGDGAVGPERVRAPVTALRRLGDAAVRGLWRAPDVRQTRSRRRRLLAPAGRRDRVPVGTVRGPDPRPDSDRRGTAWTEYHHDRAAARLRTGRRHLTGSRGSGEH